MKTNFLFFLNSYSDLCQSTTPALNQFKWSRQINGIPFKSENDQQIQILPSITTPNVIPYPFSIPTNTSQGNINSTDVITVTGDPSGIAIGNLVVGSNIPLGTSVIDLVNTTVFTVTSANASSGATYTNNGQTFTVVGNLIAGTILTTTGTGAPLSSGTLTLASGTGDATIAFSAFIPPTVTISQSATSTASESIVYYAPASFIYLESDQQVSVIYNNGTAMVLNPFQINGLTQPAVYFMSGPIYSLTVNNLSTVTANVFFACMG